MNRLQAERKTRNERIVELFNLGFADEEIALDMNLCLLTVQRCLHEHNLIGRKHYKLNVKQYAEPGDRQPKPTIIRGRLYYDVTEWFAPR